MTRRLFFSKFSIFLKSNHCPLVKMSTDKRISDVKRIYLNAIQSVQPENLINESVIVKSDIVTIQNKQFSLSNNVYIVGFGKAVLGMARALEIKLKGHILSGIVSVPEGICNSLKHSDTENSVIQVYEGALNNNPDEKSKLAAEKISEFVSSLKETDLLFVLISGGGSALLPAPKPPLTLKEKIQVIKLLAGKGASIEELNAVRKKLSTLKGGGLAMLAKPTQTISLILSDIIGDPLDSIASGPTVENTDDPHLPLAIIEKYNLTSDLPANALNLLQNNEDENRNSQSYSHVHNFIIGNNKLALESAAATAHDLNYISCILTDKLAGTANIVGKKLISLVTAALKNEIESVYRIGNELSLPVDRLKVLLECIANQKMGNSKLCVLLGGETVVEVLGTGTGGRNQELALAAAMELNAEEPKTSVVLLSAGTDGIDGPTDAAGAIATECIIKEAKIERLQPTEFLNNNDSYNFFAKLRNGQYHIKIGHTGTNVMDIIIILIE